MGLRRYGRSKTFLASSVALLALPNNGLPCPSGVRSRRLGLAYGKPTQTRQNQLAAGNDKSKDRRHPFRRTCSANIEFCVEHQFVGQGAAGEYSSTLALEVFDNADAATGAALAW
jgi:hypothetical protein